MNAGTLTEAQKLISGVEGWGGLSDEHTDKQKYEADLQRFEHAQRIAGAFGGATGANALAALVEQFVDPPTWPLQVTNSTDQQAFGYIREGQKSVITAIRNAIKISATPPTKPQTAGE
jgi:hypothetical protein